MRRLFLISEEPLDANMAHPSATPRPISLLDPKLQGLLESKDTQRPRVLT
jgi:hypothetical protein